MKAKLEVFLVFGCVLIEISQQASFDSENAEIFSDEESLRRVLTFCQDNPALCSEGGRFYSKVTASIRHTGIKKSSAIFMSDILKACIDKGVAGCDRENTIISLNALSQQKREGKLLRIKRNLKRKIIGNQSLGEKNMGEDEDNLVKVKGFHEIIHRRLNTNNVEVGQHRIGKRAFNAILSQIMQNVCFQTPWVCREVKTNSYDSLRYRPMIANM